MQQTTLDLLWDSILLAQKIIILINILQGNIHFNLSNGLRTVDKSIIYQYQPTDTPESTPCSSQIPQSRKLNST